MERLQDLITDEKRLHVLMSALPGSRALNPVQWDNTVEFWKARIYNFCRAKKRIWFTPSELFNHFEVGDAKPFCLPSVLTELKRTGAISDRQTLDARFSWPAWAAKYFIWTPVNFISSATSYLPIHSATTVDRPNLPDAFMSQTLFIPSLIQDVSSSSDVLNIGSFHAVDSFDAVFSPEDFADKFLPDIKDADTRHFIVESWKHKGLIKTAVIKGKEVYKIGEAPVSESDANLLEMKKSITSFEAKINQKQKEHDDLMGNVKKSLNTGSKMEARRLLRNAKLLREDIEKYRLTVERLYDAKSAIDAAVLNAKFIGAVQSGSEVLKQYVSPKTVNEVSQVMDEMEEQTSVAQEISSAISTPMETTDTSELEAELASLILSSEGKNVTARSNTLPEANDIALPVTPVRVPKRPSPTSHEEPAILAS